MRVRNPMKKCSYCGAEYPDDTIICVIDHTSLDSPPLSFSFPWAGFFAWFGLLTGMFGTFRATLLTYPFFWLHHDIGNGGVLWFGFVCITAFYTFLIGLPCAIVGLIKGRRLIGCLGVIFSIAPVPLACAMLHIAMALNGFHFTD